LTYDAPAVCSEAQLRDELDARVPGARFAADAGVRVIVRIDDTREGYLAELTVIAPGAPADRRLFAPAASCADATDVLAGAIAAHLAALPPPALGPGEVPAAIRLEPIARFEAGVGGELVGGDAAAFPETVSALDVVGLARVCGALARFEACGLVGAGLRRLSEGRRPSYSELGGFGVVGGRVGLLIPVGRRIALEPSAEALVLAGQPTLYRSDIGSEPWSLIIAGTLVFAIDPSTPNPPRHP
jgi:hypothetical protein